VRREYGGRRITHGAMRSQFVVFLPPILYNHPRLLQASKELPLQAFVPEPAEETLYIGILPGTAGIDIDCTHAPRLNPVFHSYGYEFRAVVAAYMLRNAPLFDQGGYLAYDINAPEVLGSLEA